MVNRRGRYLDVFVLGWTLGAPTKKPVGQTDPCSPTDRSPELGSPCHTAMLPSQRLGHWYATPPGDHPSCCGGGITRQTAVTPAFPGDFCPGRPIRVLLSSPLSIPISKTRGAGRIGVPVVDCPARRHCQLEQCLLYNCLDAVLPSQVVDTAERLVERRRCQRTDSAVTAAPTTEGSP